MLAPAQHNISTRIGKEDANQRERSIDVDIKRSGVGNAMHHANMGTCGSTVCILRRAAPDWNRKRNENEN